MSNITMFDPYSGQAIHEFCWCRKWYVSRLTVCLKLFMFTATQIHMCVDVPCFGYHHLPRYHSTNKFILCLISVLVWFSISVGNSLPVNFLSLFFWNVYEVHFKNINIMFSNTSVICLLALLASLLSVLSWSVPLSTISIPYTQPHANNEIVLVPILQSRKPTTNMVSTHTFSRWITLTNYTTGVFIHSHKRSSFWFWVIIIFWFFQYHSPQKHHVVETPE